MIYFICCVAFTSDCSLLFSNYLDINFKGFRSKFFKFPNIDWESGLKTLITCLIDPTKSKPNEHLLNHKINYPDSLDSPLEYLDWNPSLLPPFRSHILFLIILIIQRYHQFHNISLELQNFQQIGSHLKVNIIDYITLSILIGCMVAFIFVSSLFGSICFIGDIGELSRHVYIEDLMGGKFWLKESDHI